MSRSMYSDTRTDDRTLVERVYRHNDPDGTPRPPIIIVRNVVAVVAGTATALQFVLWVVLCFATASMLAPWWVWTLLGGGLQVAGLTMAIRSNPPTEPPSRTSRTPESPKAPKASTTEPVLSWRTAARIAVPLLVVATAAQIIVWAMQGLFGGWDAPWWAWSALPQAGLTAVVVVLARHEGARTDA